MVNISQIDIKTVPHPSKPGQNYDQVRLWIDGIPFSADLVGETMLAQVKRIARDACVPLIDHRARTGEV